MKSILFIDRDSQLAKSVKSLAEILDIPFELVARKNAIRQLIATGNVGMIIANTAITTIRFEDVATEIDTIQKRARLPEVPIFYICNDTPTPEENLPASIPSMFLIKRSTSLEHIYTTIEQILLSDKKIEQSGGFIKYSETHKTFINSYQKLLNDLQTLVQKMMQQ